MNKCNGFAVVNYRNFSLKLLVFELEFHFGDSNEVESIRMYIYGVLTGLQEMYSMIV